tara:strand:- start:522 stop:2075 length:1554 start_codon:yes stop_codon:yes gene_type:complete
MFLRGILSKILSLLLVFNIALWAFIFMTEDASIVAIHHKKDQLYERSTFYVKLIEPIFARQDLSQFERKIVIEALLRDQRLVGTDHLVITEFKEQENDQQGFSYFDGKNSRVMPPIQVEVLPNNPLEGFATKTHGFDPLEGLFVFYKSFFDLRIVTDPYVPRIAIFTRQFQLLNPIADRYELSYLVPIKVEDSTLAVLNISDSYHLREAYLGRNRSRLEVLAGLSLITIIFGILLAVSIAIPIRQLSKRLNRRLEADTLVDQLAGFEIRGFEKRKDEVGLLYRNLSGLYQQIISLFIDKERFAADVSHELKNPIAAIIANTENGISHAPDPEAAIFVAIQKQAVRMNKLISEISEAAIVDHELVALRREKFDLSTTIRDLIDFFETSTQDYGVRLTSELQGNIKITGLPDRMARVIINLIENAVSFAGSQGQVHVTLSKTWRKGLVISVEDTGPGVLEFDRNKIFDRFYSSREGSSVRKNSSGLGLYICKQVIEAHGGKLTIGESKNLGGALFTINL